MPFAALSLVQTGSPAPSSTISTQLLDSTEITTCDVAGLGSSYRKAH